VRQQEVGKQPGRLNVAIAFVLNQSCGCPSGSSAQIFFHRTAAKLELLISVEHSMSVGTKELSPCKINKKQSRSHSHCLLTKG